MLSGVLRSRTAVTVNVAIMRAFVELRRAALSYATLEQRLTKLERESKDRFGRHDRQLADVFEALRQLISRHRGQSGASASDCPGRRLESP